MTISTSMVGVNYLGRSASIILAGWRCGEFESCCRLERKRWCPAFCRVRNPQLIERNRL